MEKKTLKEHRLAKHLSQQDLADRSGISLRTVQRIEKNESAGSPYVIRTLCKTLDIETDSLVQQKDQNDKHLFREETLEPIPLNKYLKYINISAVSVILFPFLNLAVVTALYLILKKRFTIQNDRSIASKILSLQILWSVATLAILIFTPLFDHLFLHIGEILEIPLFIWAYLVMLFSHLLITLTVAVRLNLHKDPMPYIPNII